MVNFLSQLDLFANFLLLSCGFPMGGVCCKPDLRPQLRIELKHATTVMSNDRDGETEAYVKFHYGNFPTSG